MVFLSAMGKLTSHGHSFMVFTSTMGKLTMSRPMIDHYDYLTIIALLSGIALM